MGDERGSLIAVERSTGLPFEVQRVYFIFGTAAGVTRGLHAHRNLKQWVICVAGSLTLTLDDGQSRVSLELGRPHEAIEIDGLVWREMDNFSSDAVLLVLASRPWEPDDYIRDYAAFAEMAAR